MFEVMSPFVRLKCDVGNPTLLETKVAWERGKNPQFNESFFVDIKESKGMYVSVWSKGLHHEEFIGRGIFNFSNFKGSEKDANEGQLVKVPLHDIQHGERPARESTVLGTMHLQVRFLDPLKDQCGEVGEASDSWMLPKHRMQFALSRMGGRLKVGKVLGTMPPGKAPPEAPAPESGNARDPLGPPSSAPSSAPEYGTTPEGQAPGVPAGQAPSKMAGPPSGNNAPGGVQPGKARGRPPGGGPPPGPPPMSKPPGANPPNISLNAAQPKTNAREDPGLPQSMPGAVED